MLKRSAESYHLSERGNQLLTMHRYKSRAVQEYTGNHLPVVSPQVLARFAASRFHAERKLERMGRKSEFDKAFQNLQPVALAVVRELLEHYPTQEKLFARIGACMENVLAAAKEKNVQFTDPRRGQGWAVVYLGIEAWKFAFSKYGIEWDMPSISEFMETIVGPVEDATYRGVKTPLESFQSFWYNWMAVNTIRATNITDGSYHGSETAVKGKDEIWCFDAVEDSTGKLIKGYWISGSILDQYDKQALPDLRFGSIKSFGEKAIEGTKISREIFCGEDGRVKAHWFSENHVQKAAFLPMETDPGSVPTRIRQMTWIKLRLDMDLEIEGRKISGSEGDVMAVDGSIATELLRRNLALHAEEGDT